MRRSAAILFFLSVFTATIFVGLVHAQQPSPPQPAQPRQENAPLSAQEERLGPPPGGSPVFGPEYRAEEIEGNLANLSSCEDRFALGPHCEAVKALLEFIGRLGLSGASGPFPSCDPALIPLIAPLNLKVTTAIDFHKYSDGLLDEYRRNGPLRPFQKSELTALNDEAIRAIVKILQQNFYGRDLAFSDRPPLIHYEELARLAEQVLDYNFQLARWGVDAGFLTGARGYAVYQYVFNCIRPRDFRLIAEQMAARAYAVLLAANSQSYFSREAENLSKQRREHPLFWAWRTETDIIERGFPTDIYLGSDLRVRSRFAEELRCPIERPIRNFNGHLVRKPGLRLLPERPEFTFTAYELAPPPNDIEVTDCADKINSSGLPAINGLLISSLALLAPASGGSEEEFRGRLGRIAERITNLQRVLTARRWLEECLSPGPNPPPREACKALEESGSQWISSSTSQLIGPGPEIVREGTEQQRREAAEYRFMEQLSRYVRDSLSPRINFEEVRDRR